MPINSCLFSSLPSQQTTEKPKNLDASPSSVSDRDDEASTQLPSQLPDTPSPKVIGQFHDLSKVPSNNKWVPPEVSDLKSSLLKGERVTSNTHSYVGPNIIKADYSAQSPFSDDGSDKVDSTAMDVTIKGAILNGVLATSKLLTGVFANSPAMISDAAHSFADIATDAVTFVTYKISR